MNETQNAVAQMFVSQLSTWELAKDNFNALNYVKTRNFTFDGFEIKAMFNPGRIVSSKAKTDAKSIAERPCFLCAANRPKEQEAVAVRDFEVLLNPYPIFSRHLTIAHKEHKVQQFLPFVGDFLYLAEQLPDYELFFNGARCGASAPDHMHFQACGMGSLPVTTDYQSFEASGRNRQLTIGKIGKVTTMRDYLRTVYCVESGSESYTTGAVNDLISEFKAHSIDDNMINCVCCKDDKNWRLFIFPRKEFRPWQYSADGEKQLLISPATVEMSGLLVTPDEEHFNRVTKDDIISIYSQISL